VFLDRERPEDDKFTVSRDWLQRLHDIGGKANVERQPPELWPIHKYDKKKKYNQWWQNAHASFSVKGAPVIRPRPCAAEDACNQKSGENKEEVNSLPSVCWTEYMVNKHHQHGYRTKTVESPKTMRLGL
jgi:hypothetical protein